jgi:uncharacterized protein YecT (DUF1311 family)
MKEPRAPDAGEKVMHKFSLWILGGALVCAVGGVEAEAAPKAANPASAYEKCLARPSGQTTYGMVECIGVEVQAQDARLNRAYQAAIARLERPRQKAALQKAQRAWIAFRDADCASYLDEDWGSIARVEANQCVLDRTRQRADELEVFRKES